MPCSTSLTFQDLQSILELDLWCRSRVTGSDLAPNEVADAAVVSRRQPKTVGLTNKRLTDYVPLYFSARNAMLLSRKEVWAQLVVLDISPNVVDLPGTRVTLRNAAAGSKSEDYPVTEGLARIQEGAVYRDGWWDANPEVMRSMKQALQAEVLVPRRVPASLIMLGRVVSDESRDVACRSGVNLPVIVDEQLFFGNWR